MLIFPAKGIVKPMNKLSKISRNGWIYIACLAVSLATLITFRVIEGFGDILWISDISSIIGILATIALTGHHPIGYLLFAAANCILLYVTWIQQVYFSFGNFAVGIILMLWGFISFYRNKKKDSAQNAKKLTKKQWLFFALFYAVVLPAVMVGLWALDSRYFYLDAFVVAGTLTATALISNQFYQAYYFYITGNMAAIILYILLSMENINNVGTVVMYVVFQVTNFIGLATWKKIYNSQLKSKNSEKAEKMQENLTETGKSS